MSQPKTYTIIDHLIRQEEECTGRKHERNKI
jgi:hypothetical protein